MSLSIKERDELLNNTEICYISTSDLKGNPLVKPIWFIYHKGKIWFETHLPTRTFKNIEENNRVCMCFGGRETYIIWGSVKWFKESEAPLPFRKMLWDKYGKDMDDSYITEKTRIFVVDIRKEVSWHYAPTWD